MFIKLHRINVNGSRYYLSEIVINVSHVSYITENKAYRTALTEGHINIGLDKAANFTDVIINKNGISETITVVGDVDQIETKINKPTRSLLRG